MAKGGKAACRKGRRGAGKVRERPHMFYDASGQDTFRDPEIVLVLLLLLLRKYGFHAQADVLEGATVVECSARYVKENMKQGQGDLLFELTTSEKIPRRFLILIEIKGGYAPDAPLRMGIDYFECARTDMKKLKGRKGRAIRKGGVAFGLMILVNLGPGPLGNAPDSTDQMRLGFEDFKGIGAHNSILKLDAISTPLSELLAIPHPRLRCKLALHHCAYWKKKYGKRDLVRVFKSGGVPRSKWSEEFAKLAYYLYDKDKHEMVRSALIEAGYGSEKVESIAEALMREGEAKGEAKGLVRTLLRLVRQKFKRIPKNREAQVRSASLEQLEDWLDRLLEAPDLETLFGGSGSRRRGEPQPQG